MNLVTKEDFEEFKSQLFNDLSMLIASKYPENIPKFVKSKEARRLLQVSAGKLQQLRVTGALAFKKIGGSYYYRYEDIKGLLDGD